MSYSIGILPLGWIPWSIESPAPWDVLPHGLSSTMDALFHRVSCLMVSLLYKVSYLWMSYCIGCPSP